MSKFLSFFLAGVILILLITGFLILVKNNLSGIIFKPLATIKEVLFDLFTFSQPGTVDLPIVEKEDLKEKENIKEEENLQKEPDISSELNIDEIVEKLDEISEKIDLLTQEVEKLLGKEIEKAEFFEETEKEDKNEVSEEEKLEEVEDESEQIAEEAKTPEKDIILCEKGGQSPVRDKIILNEISWMGTNSDWRNEWIELKNISNSEISLKGWQILDKNEEIKIIFEGKDKISVSQFYLLERTNDDAVPNILADKIYSGNLNDENEILYLFDENCQLQDEILANPNWPAGDKNERKSMERDSDLTWYTYFDGSNYGIFGTPKAENSPKFIFSSSGGSAPPPEEEEIPAAPPLKILISEIKISPLEERFIELYNPNENEVDLTSWYIQRKTPTGTSWTSLVSSTNFEGKKIMPKSYFLISRVSIENFDIILEDLTLTEDNVILLKDSSREVADKVGWGQAQDFETAPAQNPPSDESLGRKWFEETEEYQDTDNNQEDFEIQNPTPKEKNQNFVPPPFPVVEDNIPPQVSFDSISSLQTETSFSLSWVGQDLALENATTSGIAAFYIQYNVTLSDIDGIAIQYQDINNNWQEWGIGQILNFEENQNYVNLLVEEGRTYSFQIKAKDKVGNESDWIEIEIEVNTLPIVISEIAWMGTKIEGIESRDWWRYEWLELYNNTSQAIPLEGWKIELYQAELDWALELEGKIPSEDFFLIVSSDKITSDFNLNYSNLGGKFKNSGQKAVLKDSSGNIVDYLDCFSYGEWFAGINETKETMERKNPLLSGNDLENWADSQNPGGTPKSQNSKYLQ